MKIRKPLDSILNTGTKTKILRFLCSTGAEWNGRQIAREVGMTPAASHNALNSLRREGMLLLRNMGKTHIYTLNRENFVVSKLLMPLFVGEDKALETVINIVKRQVSRSAIKNEIISVALFGSVVSGQDRSTSDIDLIVIVKNQKVKAAAERLFEKIDQGISRNFGNIIAPYINSTTEFKVKYNKNMAIIKNILKSHILLYGEKLAKII